MAICDGEISGADRRPDRRSCARSAPQRDQFIVIFPPHWADSIEPYQFSCVRSPLKRGGGFRGGGSTASPTMTTLYDLLGALSDDGADEIRTAFRKAVKGAHPDLNPGDPDAAQKFRQIVHANDILSDDEQRAAYDHLLMLAYQEQAAASRHRIAAVARKVASGIMAVSGLAVVTAGGYLLFMHISVASVGPASYLVAAREAVSLAQPAPTDGVATADAKPASDIAGGVNMTVADLGPAVLVDTHLPVAYIDRATIFYRPRKPEAARTFGIPGKTRRAASVLPEPAAVPLPPVRQPPTTLATRLLSER